MAEKNAAPKDFGFGEDESFGVGSTAMTRLAGRGVRSVFFEAGATAV